MAAWLQRLDGVSASVGYYKSLGRGTAMRPASAAVRGCSVDYVRHCGGRRICIDCRALNAAPVSYTHLTLPTILRV